MKPIDWSGYGGCVRCGAPAGQPCSTLRPGMPGLIPVELVAPHYLRAKVASAPMHTLTIRRPDEEQVIFLVNGKEVGSFSRDTHGWAGMNAALDVALNMAKAVGMTIEGGP